jgi:hypothetical protein
MREICTSGSMSGERKRSGTERLRHRASDYELVFYKRDASQFQRGVRFGGYLAPLSGFKQRIALA